MSELISALERIAAWYLENEAQSNPIFQPGLSRNNIDEQVKDLQFCIPEEVYKLYEWCNGSSEVPIAFHQYCLSPLEQVVRLRKNRYGLNYGESNIPDDPSWFPIFELWCDHAFHVVILGDKEKCPIQAYDPECENYAIYYASLTDMLLHSAEWLEECRYFDNVELWEVDNKTDARLQVKYRVPESIDSELLKWL